MADKKELIEKAIHAGLGTEKFLEGVSLENLESMVQAIEERDGQIISLKTNRMPEIQKGNITTVDDLIKAKRIKVRPVQQEADLEEFLSDKKGKKVKKDGKEKA